MADPALTTAIFVVALLYAAAGHGGASGYLAVMGLFSVEPAFMKPAALTLNLIVSSIALARFRGVGGFSWRCFWPFAAASIPAAYLGGYLQLPPAAYQRIAGVVLLWAGARLSLPSTSAASTEPEPPAAPVGLAVGAGLGLLSGLVGVGGGIFLTPVLLLAGWADARVTAGVSAAFVLVNSLASLAGQLSFATHLPPGIGVWALAAAVAGWLGATLGSRYLALAALRRWLGILLLIGAVKLLLGL